MRIVLLLIVIFIMPLVLAVSQEQYSSFSKSENRLFIMNDSLVLTDDALYKIGYYSVNGSPWESFVFMGDFYANNTNWLANNASYNLPSVLQQLGTHYVIVYSCSRFNNAWDCHGNAEHPNGFWQLEIIDVETQLEPEPELEEDHALEVEPGILCDVGTCNSSEYCFDEGGVCLLKVSGDTYFVATDGNDTSGDGSFNNPWESLQKAISMSTAGDISYFRGGVYYPTMYAMHDASLASWKGYGYDGTVDNPVRFFNYPGEEPVFDNINQVQMAGQRGLLIRNVDYAHYKGLTFRNVLSWGPDIGCIGVWAWNSTNITFENMVVHNVNGHGFFASSKSDDIYYINCDSYNNSLGETTQASDGFNAILDEPTQSVYYRGCRSWGNSDDGFDIIYGGYAEFDNCWAFDIGPGDGNGFKIVTGLNQDVKPLMRKITNCISAGNKASGFHENSYTGIFNMHLYNSLAYKNGFAGFYVPNDGSEYPDNENIYRNNIAYNNTVYEAVALRGNWVHDHNSWDSFVVVNDEDFVLLPESLDELYSVLSAPRQADGSLPDIGDYFKLASDSDLIDVGVDVGIPYNGVAPDLGPFEYQR